MDWRHRHAPSLPEASLRQQLLDRLRASSKSSLATTGEGPGARGGPGEGETRDGAGGAAAPGLGTPSVDGVGLGSAEAEVALRWWEAEVRHALIHQNGPGLSRLLAPGAPSIPLEALSTSPVTIRGVPLQRATPGRGRVSVGRELANQRSPAGAAADPGLSLGTPQRHTDGRAVAQEEENEEEEEEEEGARKGKLGVDASEQEGIGGPHETSPSAQIESSKGLLAEGIHRSTVDVVLHPNARALAPGVARALLDACGSPSAGPTGGSLPVLRDLESLLCSSGMLLLPDFPDVGSFVSLLARASALPGAAAGGTPMVPLPDAPSGAPAAASEARGASEVAAWEARGALEEAGVKGMVLLCVEGGLPRTLHLFLRLLPAPSAPAPNIFPDLSPWLVCLLLIHCSMCFLPVRHMRER